MHGFLFFCVLVLFLRFSPPLPLFVSVVFVRVHLFFVLVLFFGLFFQVLLVLGFMGWRGRPSVVSFCCRLAPCSSGGLFLGRPAPALFGRFCADGGVGAFLAPPASFRCFLFFVLVVRQIAAAVVQEPVLADELTELLFFVVVDLVDRGHLGFCVGRVFCVLPWRPRGLGHSVHDLVFILCFCATLAVRVSARSSAASLFFLHYHRAFLFLMCVFKL